MAIAKHQELSARIRGGGSRPARPAGEHQTREVYKVRLDPEEYRKLEASLQWPDLRNTDAGSLGIRAGMAHVLEQLRKGFVNGY